ncbi:MAG: hypothetical protein ACREUW_15235 [Burkholderiales bacterium]
MPVWWLREMQIVRTLTTRLLLTAALAPALCPAAWGQSFDGLKGRWIRPDGGYTVTIRSVEAGGKLDAVYANPNPLPFSAAQASREGGAIRVFLELRAGGYNGSNYTLTYDPGKDILRGTYFQAVAGQKYEVYFVRAR